MLIITVCMLHTLPSVISFVKVGRLHQIYVLHKMDLMTHEEWADRTLDLISNK